MRDAYIDIQAMLNWFCRFFRSTAYRRFVWMVYGHLGNRRYPLPACAYEKIRREFMPAIDSDFVGFVEEDPDSS